MLSPVHCQVDALGSKICLSCREGTPSRARSFITIVFWLSLFLSEANESNVARTLGGSERARLVLSGSRDATEERVSKAVFVSTFGVDLVFCRVFVGRDKERELFYFCNLLTVVNIVRSDLLVISGGEETPQGATLLDHSAPPPHCTLHTAHCTLHTAPCLLM